MRKMTMRMGVRFPSGIAWPVAMPVMFVMHMRMRVLQRLMDVLVLMVLRQV